MLRGVPSVTPDDAVAIAGEVLANPSRRDIDAPVLAAMGVAPADTAALRAVMRKLAIGGKHQATLRFARRLLASKPGDWEAQALLRWLHQGAEATRVTVPVVADSLW